MYCTEIIELLEISGKISYVLMTDKVKLGYSIQEGDGKKTKRW